MQLIIDGKQITEPIINILKELREECSWNVFSKIENKGDYIRCTCPYHSGGREQHPSFSVYANYNGDVMPGTFHCFTCGEKGQLPKLVADVLEISITDAKQWLIDKFCNVFVDTTVEFPEWNVYNNNVTYLDESILDQYAYFHPYMFERKLKEEVIRKFKVGYDIEKNAITFPVWNEYSKLVGITRRHTDSKVFEIPANMDKPIYLFNVIKKENYPFVIITEAQIDALTAWGYGAPAVAMLGTGSDEQYNILNKYRINCWVTMFDNDEAGRKATERFNKKIRKDCFVINIKIPDGKKDINDLSEEEFNKLLNSHNLTYRIS